MLLVLAGISKGPSMKIALPPIRSNKQLETAESFEPTSYLIAVLDIFLNLQLVKLISEEFTI